MDSNSIIFSYAEPEDVWIKDIVFEVFEDIPAKLFGELKPWGAVITQYPFIHKYNLAKAMDAIYEVRNKKTILNENLFPKDVFKSEDSFDQFIKQKPLHIMITGDTIPLFFQVSELLVEEFGTYNITPEFLVKNQIKRNTFIGRWLKSNLDAGNGIPICVLMKLLSIELTADKYAHKGFILTGFPIIPDLNTSCGIPFVLGDKDDNNSAENTKLETDFYERNDFINSFRNKQFVLPDGKNELLVNDIVRKQLNCIYCCFRPDYIIYLDTHNYSQKFSLTIEVLQKFILYYFRENVIRIDCRIGMCAIVNSIRNRFKYVNFKKNYECSSLNRNKDSISMSLEEYCNTDKVLPNYKWWISKFGSMCPVNLFLGRLRFCDGKYAIRYLRYIFMCYSYEHRNLFIENPGKYMNLLPKCRVAVIGPHRTGKSTLSKYIAQYFKADIYKNICFEKSKLAEEYENEASLFLRAHSTFRQNKIDEWNACVFETLNDILDTEKSSRFDLFTVKNAEWYFQTAYSSTFSKDQLMNAILDEVNFEQTTENMSSNNFLSWLRQRQNFEIQYKQYVIDSAPLNISFWKELLREDELPDCVFFLKCSSLKTIIDLYSKNHNENCINKKYISETLSLNFSKWKDNFKSNVNLKPSQHKIKIKLDQSHNRAEAPFFISRYEGALKFIEKYEELQIFFQENNVRVIEVDISQQSWTKTIFKALEEYLFLFETGSSIKYDIRNVIKVNCGSESSSFLALSEEKASEKSIGTSYGDSLDWCPVSLNKHSLLKKGNPDCSAEYRNKNYVMYSKVELAEFISDPVWFSQKRVAVPPPRVFIVGLSHRNKVHFAENLANCLNIETLNFQQNPTTMMYTEILDKYLTTTSSFDRKRIELIKDLAGAYERGAVIFGYLFLLTQFNDLITNGFYPECVFMFDDRDEIMHTFFLNFARIHMLSHSRVPVPDERFDFLCEYHKPISKVPAYLNVVDIAGLVKGAAEGQGLGNAFLSHISACDAIFHLCRAFEDPDVTHVEGEVDPVRDLDIISEELRLKDEEKLMQNLDKLEKVVARGGDKKLKPEYDSMLKIKTILCDEKKHLRFADWNLHDIETLNKYMFLTTKPAIYLINLSDKDFIRKKNKWLAKIKEWVDKNDPGATIIPFSGYFEHTLAEKDESERKAYEEETKCKTVLDKIITTGYKALQLEYFFTAGPDEVKAWTIQKGTKAPQAAGRIHTDFEKGFIMAEVMHFKDFKEEGSEAAAKSAGKYRQQGRNYVVEDGDIIFFKFNAGAGLKDAKKK